MLRGLLAPVLVAASLSQAPAAWAAEEDANIWFTQTATIDAGQGVVVTLEAQERFTNDASRLGQLLLRPQVGYRIDPSTTISIGYAYVMTDPIGPAKTHEHRLFQQLSFRLAGNGKGVTLTGRTRLEQRKLDGQSGTGWRLRQQVRLTAPLTGKVRAVAWSEPFIGFNETSFQRGGLGLWRNFVGVSLPIGGGFTIEPGYLNQYVVRTGTDRIDHTASLTISTAF